MNSKLFSKTMMGSMELKNAVVMAPMTRCRAINNLPNELMAIYYKQRSEAGLIISEGVSPSQNGLGYARIPGIFSREQTEAWKKITAAVHEKGRKIFIQLMHTGRISHPENMPQGSKIIAPSPIAAKGKIWTDKNGMLEYPVPEEMTELEVASTIKEFAQASRNAIIAGFDGVELHGANGYLLDQFLNPSSNRRNDKYGGSIENRCRFVIELAETVSEVIGRERTGIRISPYGTANDLSPFEETEAEYSYLAEKLNVMNILYIHLVDPSFMDAHKTAASSVKMIRNKFKNTLILCGGYDCERAEKDLESGNGDLIAFGRPFISNPDLVTRMEKGLPITDPDRTTFYSSDEKGFTDYPMAL
jgi:N-ethylmaleimide reductase